MEAAEQIILNYIKIAISLENSKFYRTTKTVGVRDVTKDNEKRRFKIFGFDEDLLRSALIDLRKLISDGEGTNFYKICTLVELGDFSPQLKNEARNIRKEYSKILNNDDQVNRDKPKDILDKWLNGKYFHEDETKRSSIERMGYIRSVHKLVFVATVLDLIRTTVKLADALSSHFGQRYSETVEVLEDLIPTTG